MSMVDKPEDSDLRSAKMINDMRIELTNQYNSRISMSVDFNYRNYSKFIYFIY